MDSQRDIEIATEKLVKENGWSRIKALSAKIADIKVKDV
jgi:hypothetical protein